MNKKRTFANIPEESANLSTSKIVLIPVPYDGTSTWQKGADKGPEALLSAAENMELYDIETDFEAYKEGIYIAPTITENSSPEKLVEQVHDVTKTFIKRNKFVTVIGGEHSLSIGTVRAFNECFDNLSVLQFDAHANLRKTYNGSKYNHACSMHEANQTTNLVQVGIRSMDETELTQINKEKIFFAHEIALDDTWMDQVIDQLTDNVFISFDLSVLDPSIMPSTGTPEPGGLLYYETLELLKRVFEEKNVVGFDLTELCPNTYHKASDILAAKLYYKMLCYKFTSENTDDDAYDTDDDNGTYEKGSKFKNLDDE